MTVLPWPIQPARIKGGAARDPALDDVLRRMAEGLPNEPGLTPSQRAARVETHIAEIEAYGPRTRAEIMIATQCVLLTILAEDARRDAARTDLDRPLQQKFLKAARALDKQRIQLGALPRVHPRTNPGPAPAQTRQSAVIVPLHPARLRAR